MQSGDQLNHYEITESIGAGGMGEVYRARDGKLRDELLNGEIFYTLQEARVLIEMWRKYYNQERPHSSLGYRPPAPEVAPGPSISIAS